MTEYRLWEKSEKGSENGDHLRCGVALYVDGEAVRVIGDLSDDRERLADLVRLFNEEALDPVHFEQAAEDFLLDFSI